MVRDHRLAAAVILAAFACTAGVFMFARPEYRSRYESKMIDFSKQHYYSPKAVRRAGPRDPALFRRFDGRYELVQ